MKVRCIDNLNGELSLTIGKEYEVLNVVSIYGDDPAYNIKNDFGGKQLYRSEFFEVIEKDKQQIELQCSECGHSIVCGHKDAWANYCKEHIELRKKSVLFDTEPSCRYYIDKRILEKKEELNRPRVVTIPADNILEKDLEWNLKDKELNHVVEDIDTKIKKLNEKEFIDLLEKILKLN